MKVKKKKHIYNSKYIVIIFIVVFILGITTTLQKSKRTDLNLSKNNSIVAQSTPQPDPFAGKLIVEKFPNENILWYHVTLQTNNLAVENNNYPPLLESELLPDLFNLPMVKIRGGAQLVIQKVVYNTHIENPYQGKNNDGVTQRQYNSDLYVSIKGFSLDLMKTYQNDYAKATLSAVDPRIIPYLENKDYCQQDADCEIRVSFCGYGSFNKYETYIDASGCETSAFDMELLNSNGQPVFYDGEQYDQALKCYVKANYAGSVCIKNQCKGTGRTLTCVDR
jgi:hypothetical protein